MRILFAGTPEIAVPSLERLANDFSVCGVLTNPDRVVGRGRKITKPPVKVKAEELGIHVFQFDSLKKNEREIIASLSPDMLVVFAYGRIFGKKFLSLFKEGCVNIHPSLLPMYRGSSPIISVILNRESISGITIQKIAPEMDTGDILKQVTFPLTGKETAASLSRDVSIKSAALISRTLIELKEGKLSIVSQNNEAATYCKKIVKNDGIINWKESSERIEAQIRAFNPWPGSFTFLDGKKLNIITASLYKISNYLNQQLPLKDVNSRPHPITVTNGGGFSSGKEPGRVVGVDKMEGILIQTGSDVLAVTKLQLQSKKALDWKSFVNGTPQIVGSLLGDSE